MIFLHSSFYMNGHTQGLTQKTHRKNQLVQYRISNTILDQRTAQELSYEWSHTEVLSTHLKERATAYNITNSSIWKDYSIVYEWIQFRALGWQISVSLSIILKLIQQWKYKLLLSTILEDCILFQTSTDSRITLSILGRKTNQNLYVLWRCFHFISCPNPVRIFRCSDPVIIWTTKITSGLFWMR